MEMSERVFFHEFDWKYHIFLNIKTEEWDPKILLLNYWNDLVLGSAETNFLEISSYVSVKGATGGVWEGRFSWSWLEMSHFFKYKIGEVGPKKSIV